MKGILKKYSYKLLDRRMRIPWYVFLAIILAVPLWMLLASGTVSFTFLFVVLGFVFLGLFFYVQAGQRLFGNLEKK